MQISRFKIDSVSNLFWEQFDHDPGQSEISTRWQIAESVKIGYSKGQSDGYAGLALLFEKKGHYDSAIFYQIESLRLRVKEKDTVNLTHNYLSIAKLYARLNQTSQNLKYLDKAKELISKKPNVENLIDWLSDMGVHFTKKLDFQTAKNYFGRALLLAPRVKGTRQYGVVMENYGNILNQLDIMDSAAFYYKECIAVYKKLNKVEFLSAIYNNLAYVYWDKGQKDSALYYLEKGYGETKEAGNKEELEHYLQSFIDFWEESGNLKKSNSYLHEMVVLKDSVFKTNLETKIAGIEKSFEVRLKNEENAKLKSEIRRKNTLRNAAIITALLLLILALYQLRIYRQKQNILKQEKEIKDNEIDQLLKEREVKNLDALLEGRETERKRIGRDLHDRLGSILSTVKLHFSAIDERIDQLKSENKVQYQKASDLLDEAVTEVRKIAHDLASGVLMKYGLSAALNDMKNTLESTGKIQINIFEAGNIQRENIEFEIGIYRVIQELMSNILKHAGASKADIHLTKDEDNFTVIVEDNGQGFDPQNPEKFGMGMANIKQRVAQLGGVVTFDSKPGAGATVIVEIPNKEEHHAA